MGAEERIRHRLALALARTVDELDATITPREFQRWVVFHALYDLPDGFLVTGQIGALVGSAIAANGRGFKPADFAPYYAAPRRPGRSNLDAAFAFVRANGHHSI